VAPTFVSIARNPKRDRSNISAWLMEPHMPMPNFQLTVREIADIAAYIDSLRGNP
jgi:mono/diheme cytochrome c family protein